MRSPVHFLAARLTKETAFGRSSDSIVPSCGW
jgi:hypothetical protein